jgi:transcriptional regulator with XRE-family HTH domain
MENWLRGKFLKNLRLFLEMTQEKMAGEFDMSSSMLRNIEQEKMPISVRLRSKILKRLPILILNRLGDSYSLDRFHMGTGLCDWEKVLKSVRTLSPESIDEDQIPEIASQFYTYVPYLSPERRDACFSIKDSEPLSLDEEERKRYEKYQEILKSKCTNELNYEDFQCPDFLEYSASESILTAKIDRKLRDRLNKEATNRGLTVSKLLESIVNYYFESKRLFMGETDK